jgi:23S rRNA (uridine2552-2'-O)-methyltransferase
MTRWYKEKKREHYYKAAKKTGYRARSAFKLKQINKKFNILKKGDFVVDLGAAPGGWSQVAKEIIGEKGKLVGVDLLKIKPIKDVVFLKGDMTEDSTIEKIKEIFAKEKVDAVISDMSPDISGNYSVDQARSIYLCRQAFKTVEHLLKPDGNFICKVFEGEDLKEFIDEINSNFKMIKLFHPKASRKSSSEVYIITKSYNP